MRDALDFFVGGLAIIAFAIFIFVDIDRKYKKLAKTSSRSFQLHSTGELIVDTPSGIVIFNKTEQISCQRCHFEDELNAPSYNSRFEGLHVSSSGKRVLLKFASYDSAAAFLRELEKCRPETKNTVWSDLE